MPANLNALIRYKRIDTCLRNPYIRCTIDKLQEVCTDALSEYRGIYKLVSERTIRDDLRVMRSSMLGFNAPIVFENGSYKYSDEEFSIFSTPISEINLLKEISEVLMQERNNLSNPEVDTLLEKIVSITGDYQLLNNSIGSEESINNTYYSDKDFLDYALPIGEEERTIPSQRTQPEKIIYLHWREIFGILKN